MVTVAILTARILHTVLEDAKKPVCSNGFEYEFDLLL